MNTSNSSFFRQSIHTVVSKGLLLILGFATGIVTARFLGPEGKGALSLFQVMPALMVPLASMGIRQSTAYLVGQQKYGEEEIYSSMLFLYLIGTAVTLLVIIASYWQMSLVGKYGLFVSMIFAMTSSIELFHNYSNGFLIGKKQIERLNNIELAHRFILLILLFILLYWMRLGLLGAGCGYLFGQAFSALLLIIVLRRYITVGPKFHKPVIKEMVKRGALFAITLFILQLNYRIDMLLLGKLQNEASVGIYSVGVNIVELLKQLPLAVGLVLFSRATNWKVSQRNEALKKVTMLSRVLVCLVVGMSLMLMTFSSWLIPVLYGEEFRDSVAVIWCLIPGVVMLTVFTTLQLFSAGQGKPEIPIYAFLPGLFLNVAINLYVIPKWNYVGAAVASSVSYTVATIIYLVLFNREYGTRVLDFILIKKSDLLHLAKSASERN